ncbi:DsrE family protein [Algoriphagus hitonicola]|uniref:Intracellular sulfur oxidation protein, DsrE/DsrF family n=1 Tax=Algoriphagus hitonicola TaxID=435880 RepID=A0A1I2SSF9_9BACT|nr:DsrE family protein [Algoriphagus hitonicola]SFG55632.1 Intracellular sulfur oxidation protein, DsrE/DsrF family [Algoriphagus hitonicola]
MKKNLLLFTLSILFATTSLIAQEAQFPIVKGHGGIYEVTDATERPDPSLEYKILVDLISGADNPAQINRYVDNVARLMNLHGLAGVPKDRLHVKVVVHGGAVFSILNNEKYQERFKTDNPNLEVLDALREGGAEIMVCGQSLVARGFTKEDLWPDIIVAHSMLTTATTYVPQGYVMLRF